MTVRGVIQEMIADPRRTLVERWNWKAAIFSASIRAIIFLCTNLTAGWRAATGAMLAEFVFRAITSGFYGAITQALSRAEPEGAAALASAVLLPATSHSIELVVHLLRGTPNIRASLISSVSFTILSTLFNAYAMRRGALIVGDGCDSVGRDLRRVPGLLAGFLASGPMAVYRLIVRRSAVA